ncbi:MAG: hypothetical protein JSR78_04240 [Proteobacteria bacterium]|nr:hypothetical protein [Pseudomonadota bacterium]
MEFYFDHISGKVVRVEQNWMTIRDGAGKHRSFHLLELIPDALIEEMVHALFGARNKTSQKTFAGLQNVNRGSLSVRPNHFKELARPERFYILAAISASLCCAMLFYFRNNTGDLFSLQNGFFMLVLCAGWVFPLSILERKRVTYSRTLTDYIRELAPAPLAAKVETQEQPPPTPPPQDDDVEMI